MHISKENSKELFTNAKSVDGKCIEDRQKIDKHLVVESISQLREVINCIISNKVMTNVIYIKEGIYSVNESIILDPSIHLVCQGHVVFNDYCSGEAACILIQPQGISGYEKYHHSLSFVINGENGSLTINSKRKAYTGIGIEITGNSNFDNCTSLKGINIMGYSIGILFNLVNTYCNLIESIRLNNNIIGIQLGNKEYLNSGENIRISNSYFSYNECAIKNNAYGINFKLNGCSIDMNYCVLYSDTITSAIFNECWIEAYGYQKAVKNNSVGWGGGVKVGNSDKFYEVSKISLRDTCILPLFTSYIPVFFTGSSMHLLLDNIDFNWVGSGMYELANRMENAFLVDDSVRSLVLTNVPHNYQVPCFKSNETITEMPYFERNLQGEIKEEDEIGVYKVVSIVGATKSGVVEVNGINAIMLISQGKNMCKMQLEGKNKYRIKGNYFRAIAFAKGFYSKMSSRIECYIDLYDIDEILVGTEKIYTSYRSDSAINNKIDTWWFNYYNEGYFLDNNQAIYYRVRWDLYCDYYESKINTIYFTGLHVFNY